MEETQQPQEQQQEEEKEGVERRQQEQEEHRSQEQRREGAGAPCAASLLVCTGRKCRAQGSEELLRDAARAAERSGAAVSASRCMGKCGRGPCMRAVAAGGERGAVVTRGDLDKAAELLWQQIVDAE